MKKIIAYLILIILATSCQNDSFLGLNENTYGDEWIFLYQTTKEKEVKKIVKRFDVANIHQEYFEDNGYYYIEFNYYDDIYERLNYSYCVPRRLRKNIMIITFFNAKDFENSDFKTK